MKRQLAVTSDDLLLRADAAMYVAKGDGKSTFASYEPRMAVRTLTELDAAG